MTLLCSYGVNQNFTYFGFLWVFFLIYFDGILLVFIFFSFISMTSFRINFSCSNIVQIETFKRVIAL